MLLPHSLITIVSCLLLNLSSDSAEPCIKDETSGHCYQIVDTHLTWTHAFKVCKHDGGMLISIESAEEQQFIAGQMQKRNFTVDRLWIGSDKLHPEEQRAWVNGKKFSYENWAPGEPNDFLNLENCADVYTSGERGSWNDNICSALRGYICKNANAAESCIKDETSGHCYQIVNTHITWTQAFNVCKHDGGMLVIIESASEQQFIAGQMQKRTFTVEGLWIGSNKLHPMGQRAWVNGKKFSYENWSPGEPNDLNGRGENCAELLAYTWIGSWNDDRCTLLRGYICENAQVGLGSTCLQDEGCADSNSLCSGSNCVCRSGYYDDNGYTIGGICQLIPGTSQPHVLIIGVAVGSALLLLPGVLLLYCLIWKRNKCKKTNREEAYQGVQEMEMNREYSGIVEGVYDQIADLPDTYCTIDDSSLRPNESTDVKEIY